MRLLLEHLAAHGHRRVAYLGGVRAACDSKRLAFEGECAALGLHGHSVWIDDETDRRGAGAAMAQAALRRQPRPTALVARNDAFALGAILALQEVGLAVPRDMSVTGYHDGPEAFYCRPALTSVRTPELRGVAAILPAAFAALKDGASAPARPACVRLDVHLVVRASTAPAGGKQRRNASLPGGRRSACAALPRLSAGRAPRPGGHGDAAL
jgi:DNA-binding LacI/PurR family transcriptional regulator